MLRREIFWWCINPFEDDKTGRPRVLTLIHKARANIKGGLFIRLYYHIWLIAYSNWIDIKVRVWSNSFFQTLDSFLMLIYKMFLIFCENFNLIIHLNSTKSLLSENFLGLLFSYINFISLISEGISLDYKLIMLYRKRITFLLNLFYGLNMRLGSLLRLMQFGLF